MASEKNITMRQYNGADYDTLYPKTIASQVDGVYNKTEILTAATAALYGLGADAVPDDVLNMLYPVINYAWKRRAAGYVEKRTAAPSNRRFDLAYGTNSDNCSQTVEYSAEIEFNSTTGAISLKNPQTLTVPWTNGPTIAQVLKGKYVKNTFSSQDKIVFITASATITHDSTSSSYWVTVERPSTNVFIISSEIASTGDWSIVYAPGRNAYPDSGIVDGMEYAFLGKPLDNATSAAKIETGSYVGTGTYGESNPNTLTFDFEPKLLIVSGTVNGHTSTNQVYGVTVIYIEGQNEYGFLAQTDGGYVNGNVYRDGNTISWYSTDTSSNYAPGLQFNISDKTYSYIAFG